MVGDGDPQPDTVNRGFRAFLSQSGHDPDADPLPGFAPVFNVKPFISANGNVAHTGIAAAATVAGTKGIHFPAGTTDIVSNLTISVPVHLAPGAIVRPAAGVTVTVTGPVTAGSHKWIDLSLGGSVLFTGNRTIHAFDPTWWGPPSDGTADAAAIFQKIFDSIPNNCRVRGPMGVTYRWDTTVVLNDRDNIMFETGIRTGYAPAGVPTLKWGGVNGGTMLYLQKSRGIQVMGWVFDARNGVIDGVNGAGICIDLDDVALGHIGSICSIEHNVFLTSGRPTWKGVSIAKTPATDNQEYHVVAWNQFAGTSGEVRTCSGAMTAGSNIFTATSGVFSVADVGKRFRIGYAGTVTGLITTLDTTIAGYTSATVVTLAVNAVNSTPGNVYALIDEMKGTGLYIGPNANAKKIWTERNQFNDINVGVSINGGSAQLLSNSFNNTEINVDNVAPAEPIIDIGSNSEKSRRHVRSLGHTQPYILDGIRFAINLCQPGGCYFDADQNPMIIRGGAWDDINAMPDGCHVFRGDVAHWTIEGFRFDNLTSVNSAKLGLPKTSRMTLLDYVASGWLPGDTNPVNLGGPQRFLGAGTYFVGTEFSPNIAEVIASGAGGESMNVAALRLRRQPQASHGFNAWMVGARAYPVADDAAYYPNASNIKDRGFEYNMPVGTDGSLFVSEAEAFRVTSPVLSGGASIVKASGFVCEPLKVAGVNGYPEALNLQGTKDPAKIAGPLYTGARVAGVNNAVAVAAGGTYTPDASLYETHRLVCAGNVTIGLPTYLAGIAIPDGVEMIIEILNNTAGAITVTLNGAIKGGFVAPVTLNASSRRWQYDAARAHWVPVGAQAPDYLP
jgi:hypothetical protein